MSKEGPQRTQYPVLIADKRGDVTRTTQPLSIGMTADDVIALFGRDAQTELAFAGDPGEGRIGGETQLQELRAMPDELVVDPDVQRVPAGDRNLQAQLGGDRPLGRRKDHVPGGPLGRVSLW